MAMPLCTCGNKYFLYASLIMRKTGKRSYLAAVQEEIPTSDLGSRKISMITSYPSRHLNSKVMVSSRGPTKFFSYSIVIPRLSGRLRRAEGHDIASSIWFQCVFRNRVEIYISDKSDQLEKRVEFQMKFRMVSGERHPSGRNFADQMNFGGLNEVQDNSRKVLSPTPR